MKKPRIGQNLKADYHLSDEDYINVQYALRQLVENAIIGSESFDLTVELDDCNAAIDGFYSVCQKAMGGDDIDTPNETITEASFNILSFDCYNEDSNLITSDFDITNIELYFEL